MAGFSKEERATFWRIYDALDAVEQAESKEPIPQRTITGQTKVCILGFVTKYWQTVPWNDPTWELWSCNGLYRQTGVRRFTRWFELHAKGKSLGQDGWREPTEELIEVAARVRLYLTGKDWRIPKAVVYPLKDVEALVPHGAYHAGSFDYMLALAILEGFAEIRLVGLDFQAGGEPLSARPCLEYWIGVAEGRGIKVSIESGDVGRIFQLIRSDVQYGFDAFKLIEDR